MTTRGIMSETLTASNNSNTSYLIHHICDAFTVHLQCRRPAGWPSLGLWAVAIGTIAFLTSCVMTTGSGQVTTPPGGHLVTSRLHAPLVEMKSRQTRHKSWSFTSFFMFISSRRRPPKTSGARRKKKKKNIPTARERKASFLSRFPVGGKNSDGGN